MCSFKPLSKNHYDHWKFCTDPRIKLNLLKLKTLYLSKRPPHYRMLRRDGNQGYCKEERTFIHNSSAGLKKLGILGGKNDKTQRQYIYIHSLPAQLYAYYPNLSDILEYDHHCNLNE